MPAVHNPIEMRVDEIREALRPAYPVSQRLPQPRTPKATARRIETPPPETVNPLRIHRTLESERESERVSLYTVSSPLLFCFVLADRRASVFAPLDIQIS